MVNDTNNNNRRHRHQGQSKCAFFCLALLFPLGLLAMVILVPMSLSHIEYYEYGLKKRKTGRVDTTKVYSSGRHLIGPSYQFIKYQADSHFVQIDELSVFSSGDNEDSIGLAFKVDVDFTFFLIKEELGQLHEDYAGSYETVIVSRARDAIKNEGKHHRKGIPQNHVSVPEGFVMKQQIQFLTSSFLLLHNDYISHFCFL